jgi:hypothetical protein
VASDSCELSFKSSPANLLRRSRPSARDDAEAKKVLSRSAEIRSDVGAAPYRLSQHAWGVPGVSLTRFSLRRARTASSRCGSGDTQRVRLQDAANLGRKLAASLPDRSNGCAASDAAELASSRLGADVCALTLLKEQSPFLTSKQDGNILRAQPHSLLQHLNERVIKDLFFAEGAALVQRELHQDGIRTRWSPNEIGNDIDRWARTR